VDGRDVREVLDVTNFDCRQELLVLAERRAAMVQRLFEPLLSVFESVKFPSVEAEGSREKPYDWQVLVWGSVHLRKETDLVPFKPEPVDQFQISWPNENGLLYSKVGFGRYNIGKVVIPDWRTQQSHPLRADSDAWRRVAG